MDARHSTLDLQIGGPNDPDDPHTSPVPVPDPKPTEPWHEPWPGEIEVEPQKSTQNQTRACPSIISIKALEPASYL